MSIGPYLDMVVLCTYSHKDMSVIHSTLLLSIPQYYILMYCMVYVLFPVLVYVCYRVPLGAML